MKKTFIIAEAGVNHNGNINNAFKMIDIAIDSGADAIKFQTFHADKLSTEDAKKADYQIINTNNNDTQYGMLKQLELSNEAYIKIVDYCREKNIEFISTPFDIEAVNFLDKLNVNRFKIGSGDLTNYQLLKTVALKNRPIILSTGMSNLSEVEDAIRFIRKYHNNKLDLLHCVSNYPTFIDDTNLLCIKSMNEKLNLPVGFSDHTLGYEAAIIAVTLGATIIEKHFTLDKNMEGPDHRASLEPNELKSYIKKIRETEIMLGDGKKICKKNEENIKKVVRRSLYLNNALKKGDKINESDIICLRPDDGISAIYFENVIGKKVKRNMERKEKLNWEDIE